MCGSCHFQVLINEESFEFAVWLRHACDMMLDVSLSAATSPAAESPDSSMSPLPRIPNHLRLPTQLHEIAVPPASKHEPPSFEGWVESPRGKRAGSCWCCCLAGRAGARASPTEWSRNIVKVLFTGRNNTPSSTRQHADLTFAQQQKLAASQSPPLKGRIRSPFQAMKSVGSRSRPGRQTARESDSAEASTRTTQQVTFSVHA